VNYQGSSIALVTYETAGEKISLLVASTTTAFAAGGGNPVGRSDISPPECWELQRDDLEQSRPYLRLGLIPSGLRATLMSSLPSGHRGSVCAERDSPLRFVPQREWEREDDKVIYSAGFWPTSRHLDEKKYEFHVGGVEEKRLTVTGLEILVCGVCM
jgi:hypothetical protein